MGGDRLAAGGGQYRAKRHHFRLRRIAKARVGAALICHGERCPFFRLAQRHRDGQPLAVNLTFAVKLIFMPGAGRQRRRGEGGIRRRQFDLLAVEIVTLFDLPGQVEVPLTLLEIKGKSLVCGNKVRTPGGVK